MYLYLIYVNSIQGIAFGAQLSMGHFEPAAFIVDLHILYFNQFCPVISNFKHADSVTDR
jgi:hypothetical protein